MVIKALNSENLKQLERENNNNETCKDNNGQNSTSIINRFLSNQIQQPEQSKERARSIANRSTGSSIPLEPRVPNYYHRPKAPAQADHQSSIVDRTELLKSRAELRLERKKKKKAKKSSDLQSQKSSEPKKKTKTKISALSSSIKRLPDSLPNPGKSKKTRLTLDRHLHSQVIFKKAVSGSAARRNTWGGDLTFNELSFLDKGRKSQRKAKEKVTTVSCEMKTSSHSICSQKKKDTISHESSKSPIHPSGIDPCKIRQENPRLESISRSARHSNLPSSGHSAYSLWMREKAARRSSQPIPSTSHQPHSEGKKSPQSPSLSQHQTEPDNHPRDGRQTSRVEQPPDEKSQSHDNHHHKTPIQSPDQSSSSHTRLIINYPLSTCSSLAYSVVAYGTKSFTHNRSSISVLNPDDCVSARTVGDDSPGTSIFNDYVDDENDELPVYDRLPIFPEGSELGQSDENLYYPSGQILEDRDPRRYRSDGLAELADAYDRVEYRYPDFPGGWTESEGYQEDVLGNGPELLYDDDDDEFHEYQDEDALGLDDYDQGYPFPDEEDPTYQAHHYQPDGGEDQSHWPQVDPPTFDQWYQEDDHGVAELDYAGLDWHSDPPAPPDDTYLVEPVRGHLPVWTSENDWPLSSGGWYD